MQNACPCMCQQAAVVGSVSEAVLLSCVAAGAAPSLSESCLRRRCETGASTVRNRQVLINNKTLIL